MHWSEKLLEEPVPPEVARFLAGCVRSLMALELLLLVRSKPDRERTAAELARELRSSEEWTELELRHLAACGLVTVSGPPLRYRYRKASDETEHAAAWLASSYPELRFSIIRTIYPPVSDPIRDFADAFRIRKDRPDG